MFNITPSNKPSKKWASWYIESINNSVDGLTEEQIPLAHEAKEAFGMTVERAVAEFKLRFHKIAIPVALGSKCSNTLLEEAIHLYEAICI